MQSKAAIKNISGPPQHTNSNQPTNRPSDSTSSVRALSAGLVAGLTQDSATSRAVYFAHSTSEMIFITNLLAEEPEALAGPLLADAYVTLLKGRNSWYGEQLATGKLTPDMGDNVPGKGTIQVRGQAHASCMLCVVVRMMYTRDRFPRRQN